LLLDLNRYVLNHSSKKNPNCNLSYINTVLHHLEQLLFVGEALGPLPIHISVGSIAGLGVYLLAGGAVLGIIGTFVGRE
jgi:hypothetical protein